MTLLYFWLITWALLLYLLFLIENYCRVCLFSPKYLLNLALLLKITKQLWVGRPELKSCVRLGLCHYNPHSSVKNLERSACCWEFHCLSTAQDITQKKTLEIMLLSSVKILSLHWLDLIALYIVACIFTINLSVNVSRTCWLECMPMVKWNSVLSFPFLFYIV